MLKGISPLISPELLATLYSMGHGDEIVLVVRTEMLVHVMIHRRAILVQRR